MLDQLERSIIEKLTFEEHFHHIHEEVKVSGPILKDAIKNLLAKEMIQAYVVDEATGEARLTPYCDMDNLQSYMFRATARGMKEVYRDH